MTSGLKNLRTKFGGFSCWAAYTSVIARHQGPQSSVHVLVQDEVGDGPGN